MVVILILKLNLISYSYWTQESEEQSFKFNIELNKDYSINTGKVLCIEENQVLEKDFILFSFRILEIIDNSIVIETSCNMNSDKETQLNKKDFTRFIIKKDKITKLSYPNTKDMKYFCNFELIY